MRTVIRIIVLVIILMVSLFIFLLVSTVASEYSNYEAYKSQGYLVRFGIFNGIDGCEIKLRNVDNVSSWVRCSSIGDKFVLRNYVIKQKGVMR